MTLPDNSTTTTAYTVDNGSHALVTTVTDALHNVQATHTNGSGKTVKTIQKSGPDGEITTSFEYDGIQRLVRVTDTEGNVTTSTYDMGDRRTEVNHPASGITSFTYDALGNVLTKQTANLAKEGKFITYDYDYQRLTGINYPDHPENNVKCYYGGRNASQNRIGRLMLREDGTGAIEYFYGKMGEVTKTRRTMIVPNQAIATYVTQWTYDSHNRLLEMIYPDEEKITYSYNLGGQLEKVHGYKSYGYDYVSKIGYDKFEQRTYLKYCNGAETFYTYDPQRRRLQNLTVNSGGNTIMDNAYTYDAVSNVLSVVNGASVPQSGKAGGQMAHAYTYDALYRLVGATGTYTGADNKTASYTLAMGYDNMHRITSKRQILTQNNVQFNGTLNAGYDLSYTYGTETGKKFQLANVKDVNYRTEETPSESENVNNNHAYEYDANGNLVYVNTSRTKKNGVADEKTTERKLKWDEENRLLASDDNGFVTNYWYDADGERTVKTSGESDQVYVNSEFAGGRTNTAKFSLYVSPYLVANQGGRYTKHIYIGSQRVVSKIGDFDSYGSDPRRIQYAGSETDGLSVDYKAKYTGQLQVIKDNYATFAVPYNGEDNNDYVDGKGFCCNDGSLEAAQTRALARAAKNNFQEGDTYEKMQFFYHPDHLGSSSYITNLEGEVVQHIEYVPFGEVFIEERNNIWNTPYLFNAKEFDEETGLYYYGARYYDPRVSLWISVDSEKENSPQYSAYAYCLNNPILLLDPDGNSPVSIFAKLAAKQGIKQAAKATVKRMIVQRLVAYKSKRWAIQLMDDALTTLDVAMGEAWWEYALEVIPIAGDVYGGYKLTKNGAKVWKLVQRIENRVAAIEKSLKGVRAGRLRKALGLTSGEAHHIIPVQLLKENTVVQDAVSAGFDFNGAINGVQAIKHHGPHSQYTKKIQEMISSWQERNPNYTPKQAKKFLESIANQYKKQIQKNGGDIN